MTLSNITTLSSFTDKAPASPEYFNAKFAEVNANFSTIAASITTSTTSTFGVVNVKDHGALGDGTTDDAAAIRTAIAFASSARYGTIFFPAGIYRVGSTLTVPSGMLLQGAGSPASSSGNSQTFAQLWHDFVGHFIVFDDPNTSGGIGGGGIDRLALLQNSGSSLSAACGRAISVVAPASGSAQNWLRFTDMQVENFSYTAPWTWCVYLDGTTAPDTTQIRDCFFSNVRLATNSGASGGLYFGGVVNTYLTAVLSNNSASYEVSGTTNRRSSNVNFIGCDCNSTFSLGFADSVLVVGGNYTSWSDMTVTGTTTPCVLLPSYSASTLSTVAGTGVLFGTYTAGYGQRYNQSVTLDNGQFFRGVRSDGTTARMVGLSNVNVVNVDADGHGTTFGGAITVTGNASPEANNTRTLGSASFRWNKLFANTWSAQTVASLDSTNLSVNEVAFAIGGASGASLAIRSGSTIYYFASSASTKA